MQQNVSQSLSIISFLFMENSHCQSLFIYWNIFLIDIPKSFSTLCESDP